MSATTATGEGPKGPLERLSDVATERAALEREESALVRRARIEGFTWQTIADTLGVTRQAVHKKHGKR